jgi:poly(3-hydroxybutyrate) depolymerase
MAVGPRDGRTDVFALEARAAAGAKARVPAMIIQGSADTAVGPVNANFLTRQFLLFNGVTDLPPGNALPPTLTRTVHPRAFGYVMSEYYAGRRQAAQLLTMPGLGHAWSGGDSSFEYCDPRYPDATGLVCDFFDAHRRRS